MQKCNGGDTVPFAFEGEQSPLGLLIAPGEPGCAKDLHPTGMGLSSPLHSLQSEGRAWHISPSQIRCGHALQVAGCMLVGFVHGDLWWGVRGSRCPSCNLGRGWQGQ